MVSKANKKHKEGENKKLKYHTYNKNNKIWIVDNIKKLLLY